MSDNLRAFAENQPVLPLDGMLKPQAQQPEVPQVEKRPKSEPKSQLPLAAGYYDPIRTRDALIEEVYRSEVARPRGWGRYRKFFPTGDDSEK